MANYVVLSANKKNIIEYHDLLPTSWNNISNFNYMTKEERESLGWRDVKREYCEANPDHTKYYISEPKYTIFDDYVLEKEELLEWDAETQERIKQQDKNVVKEIIREQRDLILKETDWTQISDSPISDEERKEWAAFRQAIRDMTEKFEEHYPSFSMREHLPSPPKSYAKLAAILQTIP